jgi:hypothetical protein
MTPEWIQQIISLTKRVAPKDFFGKVEINLQGGGVSNINLITSIKDREDENGPGKRKQS